MAEENSKTQEPQAGDPEGPDQTFQDEGSVDARSLDAAIAESEDLRQRLVRWQADFENLRRRSAKEVLESRQWADADFAKDLLGVLDHFESALGLDAKKTDAATILSGMKITYDELQKVLTRKGIESYDPTGQPFDPHLHEAIMQEENSKAKPMTVLQTFQRGYRLKERILRPAKVKVSK